MFKVFTLKVWRYRKQSTVKDLMIIFTIWALNPFHVLSKKKVLYTYQLHNDLPDLRHIFLPIHIIRSLRIGITIVLVISGDWNISRRWHLRGSERHDWRGWNQRGSKKEEKEIKGRYPILLKRGSIIEKQSPL